MENIGITAATSTISSPIPVAGAAATTKTHSSQYSIVSTSSSSSNSSLVGSPSGAGVDATAGEATPPLAVVLSPCAACKILRRRCAEKCVLAPYFPPNDPLKFTIAHKVFGASNIIKMLQELPNHQRADAINSMVYEAKARIRDPVYGCAGSVFQLQNQISDLQSQLAKAKAEILNMRCQNDYLVSMVSQNQEIIISKNHQYCENNTMNLDDGNMYDAWEPLWA